MNNPHDPETNYAADEEGSVSRSQKISSEVTSDEYSSVDNSMADEFFHHPPC
jgi:hypothetical protein